MRRSIFVPAAVLGAILVVAKIVLVWAKLKNHPLLMFSISYEDVIAAMAFGMAGWMILGASSKRKKLHQSLSLFIGVLGVVACIYAVANLAIIHTLGYPLNARMLSLAGRFTDLRSSMLAQSSVGLIIGMCAAPLIFLIAWLARHRLAPSGKVSAFILLVAFGWVAAGIAVHAKAEPGAWELRAGHNPHREILGSLASRLLFDRRVELVGQFPPADLDDFKSAAQRAMPKISDHPPRNVIFIVLESTAAQYLSLYGAPFNTTPHLLAESKNAIVFDRFYAHIGYTCNSRITLLFSVYPGLPWLYCYPDTRPIQPALGALLKQRGYRTAFFSAADPEYDQLKYIAADAGFDQVFGPEELGGRMASSWGTDDGTLIDGLIKWIDSDTSHQPFYAIAWTDQTHHPYTLSADTTPIQFVADNAVPYAAEMNRYLNAVRQADRRLGKLFDTLRARNLADDTLVVITGDHGEAFGDLHDVMGHGGGIYQENLRVPLMIWNPRLFKNGRHTQQVGAHVDINPTIAHLLNITPPENWQGASLFSPDHPGRAYFLADRSDYEFAVTDGRYKYALYHTDGYQRLYDLQADPTEQHDILADNPEKAAQFRQHISAFIQAEESFLKPSKTESSANSRQ